MDNLPLGSKAPEVVNVVIEIQRGQRNKYELDKKSGVLFLDRVNGVALGYPCDYGFLPGTLCEDGDPLDALLIIDESVHPGVVVPSRPIGVLYMVDENGRDEKLVCVPADDISKDHITDLADLGENWQKVVEHFYEHYKDWKHDWKGAKVSFNGWGGREGAHKVVQDSVELYKKSK